MRILITGGAGFIGSNLAAYLSANHEVVSLDNYFTGTIENHKPNVGYVHGCTTDINQLFSFQPDVIFHLGEYSRVEQSFNDFDLVYKYNIEGTKAVLDYTKRNRNKLIYAGSSTKFGDIGANSSPYAWSKSTNTQLVINYSDWFNINYAITYFYNVVGPGEIEDGPYATVIAKFLKSKRNNERVTVTAPGTQKRNFTYIDDTVNALELVMNDGNGDGYCIAAEENYSIIDIANLLELDYILGPEKRGNRMTATASTEKVKALGWKQKVKIVDYLVEEKNKIKNTSLSHALLFLPLPI